MKHRRNKAAALALALILAAVSVVSVSAAPTDATVQAYEQQIADLAARQEEALEKLDGVRGDMSEAGQTKAYYDELISLSVQKKKLIEQQLDTITTQIREKEEAILAAEENIARQEKAFRDRMVTMYEEGEASYLGLILGAESLVELLTRIDTVITIQAYDKQVTAGLKQSREDLQTAKAELERSLAMQESAMETLETEILAARDYAEDARLLMEQLQNNESALLKQYYENRAAEEELDRQLAAYLAELQARQNSSYVGGSMGWPLPLDVNYRVSSEYGYRILWGMEDNHYGIDLACSAWTEIYAANAGTVITSTDHWSYGEYVVIDHGGGQATLYAHMIERVAQEGDVVEKGQLIGYVGMSGSADGYHLHFEVRINGKHTQPRDYIVLP